MAVRRVVEMDEDDVSSAGLEDRHMEPVGAVACDDEDTEEDAEVVSSSVLTRQARDCLRARPFFGGRELTGDGEPRAGACLALAR
jgi:hypothetical protein